MAGSACSLHHALVLVLGTNIAVLLDCSKSSRQCSLPYTYLLTLELGARGMRGSKSRQDSAEWVQAAQARGMLIRSKLTCVRHLVRLTPAPLPVDERARVCIITKQQHALGRRGVFVLLCRLGGLATRLEGDHHRSVLPRTPPIKPPATGIDGRHQRARRRRVRHLKG